MATIVNNPTSDTNSSTGLIVGVLITALVVVLLMVYGLPMLRSSRSATPGANSQLNVDIPDKIDVNMQNPQ